MGHLCVLQDLPHRHERGSVSVISGVASTTHLHSEKLYFIPLMCFCVRFPKFHVRNSPTISKSRFEN